LVARALAARVGEVIGVDMTPAMLEVARREAISAGADNVRFELGDVTALGQPAGSFDGAITRFSLHHIPVPARLLAELARVVRPGGWVIVGDHVTDEDAAAAAWHQEVERLRDPSHWTCLTPTRIKALGRDVGLQLDEERLLPFELDFEEWLTRSSSDSHAAELISLCLTERPAGTARFTVREDPDGRRLRLTNSLIRWRRLH
jgi:SAM-dependent methyltransferase